MNLTFYIPEKIKGHEVGNAIVLGARESALVDDDTLYIEGDRGVRVVLILIPEGKSGAQSYVAYEWGGTRWVQTVLPVFSFDKVSGEEYLVETNEEEKKEVYPDLQGSL